MHKLVSHHPITILTWSPLAAIGRGPWLGGAGGIEIGFERWGVTVARSRVWEGGRVERRAGKLGEKIGSGWEGRGGGSP